MVGEGERVVAVVLEEMAAVQAMAVEGGGWEDFLEKVEAEVAEAGEVLVVGSAATAADSDGETPAATRTAPTGLVDARKRVRAMVLRHSPQVA